MAFRISEELLSVITPHILYWLYCGIFALLAEPEKHRLFTEEEESKNTVTKKEVIRRVLLHQAFQSAILILLTKVVSTDNSPKEPTSLLVVARQLLIALLVQDAWVYWGHRFLHTNKFMYKHVHSKHHRLVVPYPYGAVYSHPLEGLLIDTLGGTVAFLLSGMSLRTSIFFFGVSVVKTVDDHCGMWFPSHPFHRWFSNNSAFHAVHHQLYGTKYNFSASFFTFWDRLMGTYLPFTVEKTVDGGYEIRTVKD